MEGWPGSRGPRHRDAGKDQPADGFATGSSPGCYTARAGNRTALANQVRACCNMICAGDYAGARNKLRGEIRAKVDGIATAPDWMNAGQPKDHVRSEVDLISSLIGWLINP